MAWGANIMHNFTQFSEMGQMLQDNKLNLYKISDTSVVVPYSECTWSISGSLVFQSPTDPLYPEQNLTRDSPNLIHLIAQEQLAIYPFTRINKGMLHFVSWSYIIVGENYLEFQFCWRLLGISKIIISGKKPATQTFFLIS